MQIQYSNRFLNLSYYTFTQTLNKISFSEMKYFPIYDILAIKIS